MRPVPLQVSRIAVLALAVAGVVFVTTAAWRRARPPRVSLTGAPLEELRREAEALRAFDDASAAEAETAVGEWRRQLWTEEQLREWKNALPARWIVQEARPQANASTTARRFVLTCSKAPARDWPELHAFLQQLDAQPTAVIQRLKLSMSQPQTRRFDDVEVVVDLWFRPTEATTTNASGEGAQ